MSENDLLPDNPDSSRDPLPDTKDHPLTPADKAMELARELAGCESNSVVVQGQIVSMSVSEYEKLSDRKPAQTHKILLSEIEVLKALAKENSGLTKEYLAKAIGDKAPSGSLGRWISNLISHGYVEPGGTGRISRGYRITQSGREFLVTLKNGAE